MKPKACSDCRQDPVGTLKQLFVDELQVGRIRGGQKPALRPVFSKVHGVVHGHFDPLPDLPHPLKVGVFALERLTAWVRFSTDEQPNEADLNQTCGIGIKLFGVPGPKLLGHGDTQDFLFQNHDVFFVPNAQEMCGFTGKLSMAMEGILLSPNIHRSAPFQTLAAWPTPPVPKFAARPMDRPAIQVH